MQYVVQREANVKLDNVKLDNVKMGQREDGTTWRWDNVKMGQREDTLKS